MANGSSGEFDERRARFVLAMLVVMSTFSFLDRYLLAILVEPIKQELGASDAVMGFVIGPAFMITYCLAGIPVARMADRYSRRAIIATGIALWSLFTALSGAARGSAQLVIARMLIGVGEVAGSAPSHSMLSDVFPAERRAIALSIFQMGVYLGQVLGLAVGGFLVAPLGWRWTFVVVGLPGLVFALVFFLTVQEPERGRYDPAPVDEPSFAEVMRKLWSLRSFRWLAIGTGLASFAGYGYGIWIPTLFIRVHEMSQREVGVAFGLIMGISSLVGSYIAGRLGVFLGARDPRWLLRLPALAVLLSLPFLVGVSLWPDPWIAISFMIPAGLFGAGWAPLAYAAVQNLVPAHMRAVAASVLILSITILGMGAGPWTVGILSDWLAADYGTDALRVAILIVLSTSLIGAAALAMGARPFLREIRLAAEEASRSSQPGQEEPFASQ